MRKIKRILAIVLVITLLIPMLPTSVIATEIKNEDDEEVISTEVDVSNEEFETERILINESVLKNEVSSDDTKIDENVMVIEDTTLEGTVEVIEYGDCGDDVKWTLTSDGVLTISGTGPMFNYTSSNSTPWYNYKSIITAVVFEEGVTSVSSCGFYGFKYIVNVDFAETIISIGSNAFYQCVNLSELTLPKKLENIGNSSFAYCSSLKGNLIIPDSVIYLGGDSFRECVSLTSLKLGNGITDIYATTFYKCSSLTGELILPEQLITIGDSAFQACSGFSGQLIIPETVTTIGKNAFYDCTGFSGELVIPDQVTSVGDYAFCRCNLITSLKIGDGISKLTNGFTPMTGLEYIEIGVNLKEINGGINGSNVKEIIFNGVEAPVFNYDFFYSMSNLKTVYVPEESYTVYSQASGDYLSNTSARIKYIDSSVTIIVEDNVLIGYLGDETQIEIPEGIKRIESYAFMNNTLITDVVLPESLKEIGDHAFRDCSSLINMDLPENLESIGTYALYGCNQWLGSALPKDLITLGNYAFYKCESWNCELKIPEGLSNIPDYAFALCYKLYGDLIIPDTITSIGEYAFNYCTGLCSQFKLSETLKILDNGAFSNCSGLKGDLIIPDSVEYLGSYCFKNCTGFNGTLTLPENIEVINYSVFEGCSNIIGELVIPDKVTKINSKAFSLMKGIEKIVLGSNLKDIGVSTSNTDAPFYYCSSVTNVLFSCKNIPTFTGNPFYGNSSLKIAEVPYDLFEEYRSSLISVFNSSTRILAYDFYDSFMISDGTLISYQGNESEVVIPEEVTKIGDYAFRGCNFITEVKFHDNLLEIGNYAFSNISTLNHIDFPESLQIIGDYAFRGCSGLKGDLVIPSSVVKVGNYAFCDCQNLDGMLIIEPSDTVEKTIGSYAFQYCMKLVGIELGYGITTIEDNAFAECRGIKGDLIIPDSVTSFGQYAFSGCYSLDGKLILSNNVTSISNGCFSGCSSISGELVIPSKITSIGDYAFKNMSSLDSIVFEDGIYIIGNSATNAYNPFYGCSGVKQITFFGASVPTFNGNMFSSMTDLETIFVHPDAYDEYVSDLSAYVDDSVTITADFTKANIKGLKTPQVFSKSMVLSWDTHPSDGVIGYTIYRDGVEIGKTDTCTFVDRNLEPNTTYTYMVQGYTEEGDTSGTAQITATTVLPEILAIRTDSSSNKINEDANSIYVDIVNAGNLQSIGEEKTTGELYYLQDGEYVYAGTGEYSEELSDDSIGVFVVKWDMEVLSEGEYEVMFRLTDIDGAVDELSGTITIDRSVPDQIVGVVATGDIDVIHLSWAMAAEIETTIYRIYRRDDVTEEYQQIAQIEGRETLTYTDSSISKERTYYYYVVGVNDLNQEGTPSLVVGATLAEDTENPVVKKFIPENGSYLSGKIQLEMFAEDNVFVTNVLMEYATGETESWQEIDAEFVEESWIATLDTRELEDGKIWVRGTAYDAASNQSATLTYVYMVDNNGPAQVQGVSYESTNVSVTIRWDAIDDDISFYRVEKKNFDGTYSKYCDVTDTLGVHIYDLEPDTEYIFRVIAYDNAGNRGTPSEDLTVKTINDVTPPVISEISPKAYYFSENIDLAITAKDEYNVKSITIQISTDLLEWKNVHTESYDDIALARTLKYTLDISGYEEGSIYVRAVAEDLGSNQSDTSVDAPYVEYIIDRIAPDAPQNVTAVGDCGFIEISWTKSTEKDTDISKYFVYRSDAADGEYILLNEGVTALNYYDKDVVEDVVYYYKVAAIDHAGNQSDFSAVVSASPAKDTEAPKISSVSPENTSMVGPSTEIKVSAQDNYQLSSILFEYSSDGVEYKTMYELTELDEEGQYIEVHVPVEEFEDGDVVYVRVSAKDAAENVSEYVFVQYTVDVTAPVVNETSSVYEKDNEQVRINWIGSSEEDLYGYRIYRGIKEEYSMVTFCQAVDGKISYTYGDNNLPMEAFNCHYKVEAVDIYGNTSFVLTNEVEVPDRQFPKPVLSCDLSMEIGVEYQFDASLSTDNTEIVSYHFDFGDGITSTEKSPIHSYEEIGDYTVVLTVVDTDGHEASVSKLISVVERGAIGTVNIKVIDENGAPIPGAPVYFDLGEENQVMKATDSSGQVIFVSTAGVHAVGSVIANNEWLPAKKDIIVLAGSETSVTLTLVHQPIVEGEFEINRMTFEEIEAAGIDTSKPENQYIVQVNVNITYEKAEQQTSFIYNMTTKESLGEVTYDTNKDGNYDRKMTPVVIDEETIVLLDIPIGATMLKEFFDVHLHIVNNASTEFSMLDNVVTLNVPEGLTIVDTAGRESNATVEITEIPGQSSSTISWIVRGDEEGEYDLTADYAGILGQFNEPIYTKFVSESPIVVYGMSTVKLIAEVNSSVSYDAFYFNLGLKNIGKVDVNMPSIEIANNVLAAYLVEVENGEITDVTIEKEPTVKHINTVLENSSGYKQHIGTEAEVITLSPGETITKKYAAYNVSGYKNLLHLQNAIHEIAEGYGLQFELIETDMELFSMDNAVEKLNDIEEDEFKRAQFSEILDCSQYFYVLESLGRDTNIFVREGNDLYTAMKKRMAIDSSYSKNHTSELTKAVVAQMMVDESLQEAISSSTDSKYYTITENVLKIIGDWISTSGYDVSSWNSYMGQESNVRILSDKLAQFGEAYFVSYLTDSIGMSTEISALIQTKYNNGEISEIIKTEIAVICPQISSVIDGINSKVESWTESKDIIRKLIGIASAQDEIDGLLSMLIEFTDKDTNINKALIDIRADMISIQEILKEQLITQLDEATNSSMEDAHSAVLTCLDEIYGTDKGASYTFITLLFGKVTDILSWEPPVEDLHVLKVCTEISLALRQAVERYYLNSANDEEAVYTLNALKYLIKMRLIGEQCFVITVYNHEVEERDEIVDWMNNVKESEYSSATEYQNALQERLLTYRDNLFISYYTNLEIPDAPIVTLNYVTNKTNETFSSEYEYSFEGTEWYNCNGSEISFTPGTVNKYLWVRVKETDTSYSGNITKVVIASMPRITGDIIMMYIKDGYQITGLTEGTYKYGFTNDKNDYKLSGSITVKTGEVIKLLAEDSWTYLAIQRTATEVEFASQVRFLVEEQPWVINTDTYIVTGLEEQTTALQVEVYYASQGYAVTVVDANGNTTEQVGTGCIITLDGEEYQTVIRGDVDGDAVIDVFDLYAILDHINGDEELEGVYYDAGCVNLGDDIGLFDLMSEVDYITKGSFTEED